MIRRTPLSPEAQLLANEVEIKRLLKARNRIAKMLAKKRGDMKKMPLSGKAALKAIKAGKWGNH